MTRTVKDLSVIGQIERLDLRNVRFDGCTFVDAAFVNCEVDAATIFDGCTFNGTLELSPQEPWSNVKVLPTCTVRSPASLTLSSVVTEGLPESDDLMMDAFRLGLGKFWHNGRPRDNIKRDDWRRGLLGRTKYSEPVLEALKRMGVVQESEKGRFSDIRLMFQKSSIGDLQRFMDNRQLTGRIADAYEFALKRV